MLWHLKERGKLHRLLNEWSPPLNFHSTWVGGIEDMVRVAPSAWKFDVEEYLQRNCIFPIYSPFVPTELREAQLHWAKHREGDPQSGRLPPCALFFYGLRIKGDYKACPICAQEQIEKYGEPYLDRSHHIPGVRICLKHRLPLVDVGDKSSAATGLLIRLQNVAKMADTSSPLRAHGLLDHLQTAVAKLFDRPIDFHEKLNFFPIYRVRLRQTHYPTGRNIDDWPSKLLETYQDLKEYVYLGSPSDEIVRSVRYDRPLAPILHLVLQHFLGVSRFDPDGYSNARNGWNRSGPSRPEEARCKPSVYCCTYSGGAWRRQTKISRSRL